MHLLGKDILRLHCVSWPALLIAAGYEPPRRLFVHGYLTSGDHKMSKSLGNVIDPLAVIDELGADALRFYLLREVQWGQDGSVTREGLDRRYAGELANDLGQPGVAGDGDDRPLPRRPRPRGPLRARAGATPTCASASTRST